MQDSLNVFNEPLFNYMSQNKYLLDVLGNKKVNKT